jgi:phosphohistidine phosphatase
MKTVLLMRHAKSSWNVPDLPDQKRPLNHRGEKDAPRMGQLLKDQGLIPQRIYCSTALRARQTVAAVIEILGFQGEITYLDELYQAEPSAIIDVLKSAPDEVDCVLLIAHNPGMEEVTQLLTGQGQTFPTAGIGHILLPLEHWQELSLETSGHLQAFYKP